MSPRADRTARRFDGRRGTAMTLTTHDKRQRDATSPHTRLQAATFVVAASSLMLATGLACLLYSTLHANARDQDDEFSEAGVLARTAAEMTFKWAACSAVASLSGTIGVLLHRKQMVRLFAVGAAFDLTCTVILLSVLILLVSVPTLAEPFSHLLCHAVTSGEQSRLWPLSMMWNQMDICEQHWKWAMAAVIVGAAIAIALRAWGTAITWQHYNAMTKKLTPGGRTVEEDEWFDTEQMHKQDVELQTRRRDAVERRRNERERSSTLPPILMTAAASTSERQLPPHHGRFKSHSMSYVRPSLDFGNDELDSSNSSSPTSNRRRPQLVLVPVFVDEATHSPTSPLNSRSSPTFPPSFIPALATPPRRHRPSTSSLTSTSSRRSSRDSSTTRAAPTSTTTSCRRSTTTTSPRLGFVQPNSPTFCNEPETYTTVDMRHLTTTTRPKLQRGRSKSDNAISFEPPLVGNLGRGDSGYASLLSNKRQQSQHEDDGDMDRQALLMSSRDSVAIDTVSGDDADDERDVAVR
ncbi:hypothetical protein OIO90_005372 [Microbotryomycetes sp. JL221]|nr:hypothetical protein OIO90_005372 [Microbotryomycetes sp. JL221]